MVERSVDAAAQTQVLSRLLDHQREGMALSQDEANRGSDPKIKAMANKLLDRQSSDVNMLTEIQRKLGVAAAPAAAMPTRNFDDNTDGKPLDQQFLSQMIRHHEQGISMSREASASLTDKRLRDVAKRSAEQQESELDDLRDLQVAPRDTDD